MSKARDLSKLVGESFATAAQGALGASALQPNGSGAALTGIPSPVLASQSEAEAGTDSTKFMSPARVTQQITAALKTVGGTSLIGSGDIPVADAAADYGTTVYTSTGSFTASTDMTIIVQAVGAGGSGAIASHTSPTYEGANYSGTNDHAQGGASGAYSSKLLVLQTGDIINFTIGSGGGRVSVNTAGTAQGNILAVSSRGALSM